ncbi:hypothetical protein M405DRAFT_843242 [Rhizopogon salebrosus TDB-379]|nr:hypothetical protein M405DRAFT_843242 [Rhizopogon salebrosus TDB-379]
MYPMQTWYYIGLFIFIIAVFLSFTPSLQGGATTLIRNKLLCTIFTVFLGVAFLWDLSMRTVSLLSDGHLILESYTASLWLRLLYCWHALIVPRATELEGHALYLPYWCNRSGALAASQFPLITALGTKNNTLSFITGIGYDKEVRSSGTRRDGLLQSYNGNISTFLASAYFHRRYDAPSPNLVSYDTSVLIADIFKTAHACA